MLWKAVRHLFVQKHTFNPEFEKVSSLLPLNLAFAADRHVSFKMRSNQTYSMFYCTGSCFTNSFREKRHQIIRLAVLDQTRDSPKSISPFHYLLAVDN